MILSNCANQLPPGGGDVDKIPPEIIEVFPADGTTNFSENYFEIGFSEYIDKRSVKDAIFISPAFEGTPELDWSGKYVRVNFPESLKENTTYVVTIGTDVVDLNNRNRMAESFTLTFSTGDEIDRRVVAGRAFEQKREGILIFAYKLYPDSAGINLLEKKPDYISQTGTDGSFKLGGLAEGNYRIFAVQDEFRDLLFQQDQDRIGIPFKDISLSYTDTLFSNLNFFLFKADTTAPRLFNAVMTDHYHILVNLSEEFDSTIIHSNNYYLYDSTANSRGKIKYAYKGNTKSTEFVLVTEDTFNLQNFVYLFADSLKDKAGNVQAGDFTLVNLTDKPDTTTPSIAKAIPQAGSSLIDFQNQSFYFQYNDAFDTLAAKEGVSFADTAGRKINYAITFIDDASFTIKPSQKLEPKKDYIIKFDFSKFKDAAGNNLDSVYQYRFKTITGLDFTGASGIVNNIDVSKNPLIILEGLSEEKYIYKQRLKSDSNFNFERVQPGKYILWTFLDEDSSGTYNYGWHFPYKPSEEFSFYPDTLNLRPRWSQTDLKFNFK